MKEYEKHQGEGTGLELRVEEVMAQAVAILEPAEPYFEFHAGKGTGLDLNSGQLIGQVEAMLEAVFASIPVLETAEAAVP
jgi:hypothetical protein